MSANTNTLSFERSRIFAIRYSRNSCVGRFVMIVIVALFVYRDFIFLVTERTEPKKKKQNQKRNKNQLSTQNARIIISFSHSYRCW